MSRDSVSRNALALAISAVDTQATLARKLGVTRGAVHKWWRRGMVPATRCLDIERITGVPRYQLRPDLYPREDAA